MSDASEITQNLNSTCDAFREKRNYYFLLSFALFLVSSYKALIRTVIMHGSKSIKTNILLMHYIYKH